MRFACEQCQTKYSIPDDRVRGKILKIRCKNCGCLISVSEGGVRTARPVEQSGAGVGLGVEASNEGGDSTMIGGMSDFFGKGLPQADADDWHLSIDGNQNGPMPLADLTQRILEQAGSSAELFIWRDGFEGWKAVDAVPEVQAAVEKARSAPPKPAAAKAPPVALAALENEAGGDATQIGSLNLPLDIGKADEDVQDASMLSLDADAFEAFIESGAGIKAKPAPLPPKAPPPFKAPPKPAGPPPRPAGPPPRPGLPTKPSSGPSLAAPSARPPTFKTLPHPGIRPAEEPPSAPLAPPQIAAPLLPAAQAESVPNLAALIPPSGPQPTPPPPSAPLPSLPSAEPSAIGALPFGTPGGNFNSQVPSTESPVPASSKLPLIIIIGLVVALGGGGAYWLFGRPSPKGETPSATVDAGAKADAGAADAGTKGPSPTGKPEVKGGNKKSGLEGIDEDALKTLLDGGEKALSKCYAKAIKKDSGLAGKQLKVEVEVTAKGKAGEVNIDGIDSSDKLGKCVEKVIKKWKFQKGPDKKPYKARFPITINKS